MATWPSTLPYPSINSIREKPPQNMLRTRMDKGPAKRRRRTTANTRPISFTLKLNDTQCETLDTFFDDTLSSGVDEFSWTHPRTGDSVTAAFVTEPEYGEQEGVLWVCSIQLEILP